MERIQVNQKYSDQAKLEQIHPPENSGNYIRYFKFNVSKLDQKQQFEMSTNTCRQKISRRENNLCRSPSDFQKFYLRAAPTEKVVIFCRHKSRYARSSPRRHQAL